MRIYEKTAPLLASIAVLLSSPSCSAVQEEEKPSLRRQRNLNLIDYSPTNNNLEDLGINHYGFESRIVGGTEADASRYEYHVNIGGCGGSLIHPDIVLTAAHCQPLFPDSAKIGGGTRTSGETKRIVGNGTPHPAYNSNSQDYDFMLYKLASPSSKTPVQINSDGNNPKLEGGDQLTTIGFGSTFEGGSGSFRLLEVTVNHVNHTTCNTNYRGQVEDDIMFCAGVPGGGRDTCQGDSGGPIVDSNGVQVGVTSWGNGCARDGFPGVYARISAVYDWIQEEICELSNMKPTTCGSNSGGNNGNGNNGNGGNNGGGNNGNGNGGNGNNGNGNGNNGNNGNNGGNGNNNNGGDGSDLVQPKGITIRIDITYDLYPQENAWILYNDDTKEELHYSDYGEVAGEGLQQKMFTNMDPGRYVFLMLDEFWDGICCQYGNGMMQVYQLFPGDAGRGDELKWGHDGKFWNAAGAIFVVAEEEDRRRSLKALPLEEADLQASPYVPQHKKVAEDNAKR